MRIIIKRKANNYLDTARLLNNQRDDRFCAASVHCSYYAVFQYMKHMLANMNEKPISFEDQDSMANDSNSHNFIISEIRRRIKKPKDARIFAQDVRNLKNERIKADYGDKIFNIEESLECKQKADGLIFKLKTYFGYI